MRKRLALLPLAAVVLGPSWTSCSSQVPVYDHRVVNTYPHDPGAYSQGLLFHEGRLYESTGRNGTSGIRRVVLETGEVEQKKDLPYTLFGEGLALHEGELFQLTWTSGVANVFDLETFKVLRNHSYLGEGWGLTSTGKHLVMSDGTEILRVLDPETFEEVRRVKVELPRGQQLNELEWIDGEIWANVWKQDYLARIDLDTGAVTGWVDMAGIFDTSVLPDPEAVLNGIAYDAATGRIFVTGKLWPTLFEIEVTKR